MRVPGIKGIAFIAASAIDQAMELQALSGMSPDITSLSFTPLLFVGDPTLELSDTNENNGSNPSAVLSFRMEGRFRERKVAFVVMASNGAIYLIGSSSAVPSIVTKDITAGPGTANQTEVTVELSSPVAWMEVRGQAAIGDEYPPVGWDYWREITEGEVDDIIGNLPEP